VTTDVLGAPVKRVEDPRFITGRGRTSTTSSCRDDPHAILRSRTPTPTSAADRHRRGPVDARVLAVFPAPTSVTNPLPMAWPACGASGIKQRQRAPVLDTDSVKLTGGASRAVVARPPGQPWTP